MTIQPATPGKEHRVLKFRPRTRDRAPGRILGPAGGALNRNNVAEGLARYAGGKEDSAEYRNRMINNLAAAAFAIVLTLIGIWLAMRLANLRETQDCVLMGRRDCAHINQSTARTNMSSSLFRE